MFATAAVCRWIRPALCVAFCVVFLARSPLNALGHERIGMSQLMDYRDVALLLGQAAAG
jgi:hypothetical protein